MQTWIAQYMQQKPCSIVSEKVWWYNLKTNLMKKLKYNESIDEIKCSISFKSAIS